MQYANEPKQSMTNRLSCTLGTIRYRPESPILDHPICHFPGCTS